ncbi:MAG: hypothetical protein K2Q06_02495 [Parvularculaceae bacterium]|nr:hypothetical protein [Parvularculaceae bacterium]
MQNLLVWGIAAALMGVGAASAEPRAVAIVDVQTALAGETLLGAPLTLRQVKSPGGVVFLSGSIPDYGDVVSIVGVGCRAATAACDGLAFLFLRSAGPIDGAAANAFNHKTVYGKISLVGTGTILRLTTEQSLEGASPVTVRASFGHFERALASLSQTIGGVATASLEGGRPSAKEGGSLRLNAAFPAATGLFAPAPFGAVAARDEAVELLALGGGR